MGRNVPKLRFKGFNDEWKERKLGEMTLLTDGVHFTPEYVESGIPFWSVETIVSGANPKYITREAHELAIKRCYPQKDDILITRIGTLAKSKVVEDDKEFSIYVSVALVKSSSNFNSRYLKQYFDSEIYYREFLSKSLLTATPKKINMEDLKDTKIKLPSLQEQERIANFLTKVDKIIEKQDEKVKNLEKYKKGMMQKIFSQEIRFKDENGNEYPEWIEAKLSQYINAISSGKTKIKSDEGIYKVYGSTGVIGYSNNFDYCGEYVLIARVGANAGTINRINEKCGISDNTLVIECSDKMNYVFLEYMLRVYNLSKLIFGSGQPLVTGGQIKNIVMNIPILEEQIKIASFLSNVDNILKKEDEKLKRLIQLKKGLLQNMFV